jgi:hypothetical protein
MMSVRFNIASACFPPQFELVTSARNYVFGCNSAEEKASWVEAFHTEITSSTSKMQIHQQQLSV